MHPSSPRGWSGWATFGWTVLVLFGYTLLSGVVAAVVLMAMHGGDLEPEQIEKLMNQHAGPVITLSIGLPALLGTVAVAFLARARHPTLREGLALALPRPVEALVATCALAVVVVGSELIAYYARPQLAPDLFLGAMETSGNLLPVLCLVLVVVAPIFEEVLFRGFLYEGISRTRLGHHAAIFLTAGLWAGIHLQYGAFEIGVIFTLGVFLGEVRRRTSSLWLCIWLHALNNAIAVVQRALAS